VHTLVVLVCNSRLYLTLNLLCISYPIRHNFFTCESELMNATHLTGPPHMLREDDVYNGYFIPKGAIILTNLWSVDSIIRFHAKQI
jgi:hypothetical protein